MFFFFMYITLTEKALITTARMVVEFGNRWGLVN